MRRIGLSLLLAASLSTSSAAQQPGDNLGLGREFGAFDPDRANVMIRNCEDQTLKLRQSMESWRASSETFVAALDADERVQAERRAALDAVYEAETRLRTLSGPEAAQFEANIVQARRERLRRAEVAAADSTAEFKAAQAKYGRDRDSTVGFLSAIGFKDSDMMGSRDAILQRQTARCERMKLWANQSSRVRQQMREPAPISSWPDGAIDGWKGAWSCHWRSIGRDETVETDIGANASAHLDDDGTVVVYFSTEWVRQASWPNSHAKHIFSPLTVGQSQPTRGAFNNREGLGEDRAAPDAIDLSAISGDGRLRFQRRYGMQPDRQDDLECTRAG